MRYFFILITFICSCSQRNINIPDIEDKNRIPDHMESRENEEERDYLNDTPVFE
jgi:hypothetical protein